MSRTKSRNQSSDPGQSRVRKPRVEVCGHVRADLRMRQDTITVFECRDCGHAWKEISP